MEKCIIYEEKEIATFHREVYDKLYGLCQSLAVMTQQIEGTRNNVDRRYVEGVFEEMNEIVNTIDAIAGKSSKWFRLSDEIADLEKKVEDAKRDY